MWVVKIWTVNKSVILEILIHYKDWNLLAQSGLSDIKIYNV